MCGSRRLLSPNRLPAYPGCCVLSCVRTAGSAAGQAPSPSALHAPPIIIPLTRPLSSLPLLDHHRPAAAAPHNPAPPAAAPPLPFLRPQPRHQNSVPFPHPTQQRPESPKPTGATAAGAGAPPPAPCGLPAPPLTAPGGPQTGSGPASPEKKGNPAASKSTTGTPETPVSGSWQRPAGRQAALCAVAHWRAQFSLRAPSWTRRCCRRRGRRRRGHLRASTAGPCGCTRRGDGREGATEERDAERHFTSLVSSAEER